MTGPASASSARITFQGAGANGTDLVVNVDRNTAPAAYTGTYNVGSQLLDNIKSFSAQFYAGAGQSGPVVATATATISWQGSNADLGEIALDGKVATVEVVDPGTVSEVAPPFDMQFVAKDSEGTALALAPGAATWSVVSGASNMTVAPDGRATPLLPGTAVVKATVDGVASPNLDVTLSMVQVTFTQLDSSTAHTRALGGDNTLQVGTYKANPTMTDFASPALWRGSENSRVDLSPPGAYSGAVYAGNETTQVGEVSILGSASNKQAAMWTGTANSYVDLQPPGAILSEAFCVAGGRQGGAVYGSFDGNPATNHPSVWNGSAASWVSLLPAGVFSGQVRGISLTKECGSTTQSDVGEPSAALWSGTPQSYVNLHPAGASSSVAYATSETYQVGKANIGGKIRAYSWQGTASSAIDLHPSSGSYSIANAVCNDYAGGEVGGVAAIWNLQTGTVLRLDGFMPNPFAQSVIYSCAQTATGYVFMGYVAPSLGTDTHAAMWHVPFRRMPQ